ncbi:MAG: hypothetical protein FJY85_22025 [Deltaproteobacteria bacterium]|nr:hypothetical protein [Deltaproteobacteria bacterium]
MEDHQLSPLQRKWLEASLKIGPGAMTKTERQTLEKLYAEMLPGEQQELYRYIQQRFGKKDQDEGDEQPIEDPISIMEHRIWTPPSDALKRAFARSLGPKSPPHGSRD